ncbi:MAG TPA: Wzz/FepE/Etk N-terminal domain-containing protein, partial [Gemmatimonadales bacterium]|nr:Wzz/FepE/Etk N-terminal domain-containing protein [Gemmatimonadales bacterium]
MSDKNGEKAGIPVLRSESTALDEIRMKSLAQPLPPAAPRAEQSDWQRYLSSVIRHKWLVLTVTVLGTLAGFIATGFLDPRYTAKAILWVDVAVGRERGAQTDQLLDSRGWVELV